MNNVKSGSFGNIRLMTSIHTFSSLPEVIKCDKDNDTALVSPCVLSLVKVNSRTTMSFKSHARIIYTAR